jgi:hypothetical protein
MKFVENYMGYDITFDHISYKCLPLNIWGERSVASCKASIRRKLKKRNKK